MISSAAIRSGCSAQSNSTPHAPIAIGPIQRCLAAGGTMRPNTTAPTAAPKGPAANTSPVLIGIGQRGMKAGRVRRRQTHRHDVERNQPAEQHQRPQRAVAEDRDAPRPRSPQAETGGRPPWSAEPQRADGAPRTRPVSPRPRRWRRRPAGRSARPGRPRPGRPARSPRPWPIWKVVCVTAVPSTYRSPVRMSGIIADRADLNGESSSVTTKSSATMIHSPAGRRYRQAHQGHQADEHQPRDVARHHHLAPWQPVGQPGQGQAADHPGQEA